MTKYKHKSSKSNVNKLNTLIAEITNFPKQLRKEGLEERQPPPKSYLHKKSLSIPTSTKKSWSKFEGRSSLFFY